MKLSPPKDWTKNLEFRARLLKAATASRDLQEELWAACSRSIVFYLNTFGWTYDPRKPTSRLPFITWGFQDEALNALNAAIDDSSQLGAQARDVIIEKSRDMGASWLMLSVFQWRWQFKGLQSFLMASRKEDYVDETGNPDSLFWKIDFLLDNQPSWLRPELTRNKLQLINLENGSSIGGESTNGDLGRGGRRTALLIDEAASVDNLIEVDAATADVTKCRFFNSTPKGKNYFWKLRENEAAIRIALHWTQHPEKALGLYTSKDGKLEILDYSYPFPLDYPYVLDGKLRSPWYDNEVRRRKNPVLIAQELDIDYGGSAYKFFEWDALQTILKRDVRAPFAEGVLDYADDTLEPLEFATRPQGNLKLWTNLTPRQRPPAGRYAIGCDVSFGSQASNSVASVVNKATGEKVAEYVVNYLKPSRFGKACVALAKWFSCDDHAAELIWEQNGPGVEFSNSVLEAGWRAFYRQKIETKVLKKSTDRIGFGSTRGNKAALLGAYRNALTEGRFINRCKEAVMECDEYEVAENGDVYHSKMRTEEDPTGMGLNHGDRVIADALANKILDETPTIHVETKPEAPPGSFASRRQEWEAKRRMDDEW